MLEVLDKILKQKNVLISLNSLINDAKKEFKESESLSLTKNISLEMFPKLPSSINLCRLFILRANTKSKIEKHINSFQRTFTYSGEGNTKIFENGKWSSNLRIDSGDSIEKRWLSVPENTWHEPISLSRDWITITFHTASENQIIDEYMD